MAPSTSDTPGTPAATPDCKAGPAHPPALAFINQRVAKDEFSAFFFISKKIGVAAWHPKSLSRCSGLVEPRSRGLGEVTEPLSIC